MSFLVIITSLFAFMILIIFDKTLIFIERSEILDRYISYQHISKMNALAVKNPHHNCDLGNKNDSVTNNI